MSSREIAFRYELLNRMDLVKGEIDVLSASISFNSLAEIKRTASFEVRENTAQEIDYLNDRIRPIVILNGKEYPMGIFLIPSPQRAKKQEGIIRSIEAYDKGQILKEDKLLDRLFIKKGTKYTTIITQIINSAEIYNVSIEPTDLFLKRDREFEPGLSKLSVVNTLLTECNYTSLYTDGMGIVRADNYVLPTFRRVTQRYNDYEILNPENLKVSNSTVDELDLFNIPNIWVVVASNAENKSLKAVYKNESPTSPTSLPNRNRNIVDYRTVSDIADQATLKNYVKRLAYNTTNQYRKVSFETLINPKHSYSDCILIEDKKLGINAKYIETSWSFSMKVGEKMKHQGRRVIQI
jgi:hypothetical protein